MLMGRRTRTGQISGSRALRRGVPALMVAVALAAGAGPAAAAAGLGAARAGHGARVLDAGPAGVISTVAGGVGGPAPATQVVTEPCDLAFRSGHLYVTDFLSVVRSVSLAAGQLTTPAGTGTTLGPLFNGALATRVTLNGGCGVAVDQAGNLVLPVDNKVWVVATAGGSFYGKAMTAGHIYSVAGHGRGGFSGDGGPALNAQLFDPMGTAVDAAGNLLLADSGNNRIRVVAASTGTFYGQAMTTGDIYTVAGDGAEGFAGDGGPAASAELDAPLGVTVDSAGNLAIADTNNFRVRVVAAGTGTFYGKPMTAGNIYTVAGQGATNGSGDGRLATTAQFSPESVAVDGAGGVMTVDPAGRAWLVAGSTGASFGRAMTAGHIYNVAGTGQQGFSGDGGPGTSAELNSPTTAAADAAGNMVITDAGNFRVRVVAAHAGTFYGQAMTAGNIYTVAGNGIKGLSGNGGVATGTKLSRPTGVTVDGAGNLVFCDGNRVRVVATSTGTFYGQAMTARHIYTVAGVIPFGFTGDGGPATSARLRSPNRTAVDGAGNLLITDTDNVRIRVVAVSTGTFYGRAMTAGDIYTVAGNGQRRFSGDGGPATAASLNFPIGVTVDHAGNVAIADDQNERVRVVAASTGTFYGKAMTAGNIYTVAGLGPQGFSGDGGPAIKAALSEPFGVAVNSTGDLLVADIGNNRIRMVNG